MNQAKAPSNLPLSKPLLIKNAELLQRKLLKLSALDIQKVMHVSEKLANSTKKRIADWTPDGSTPAWPSFQGDVYKGLKADTFSGEDFEFAQNNAATISGLYGILRPLDAVSPYRLELGYKLLVSKYKNLYDFWGDSIVKSLPQLQDPNQKIINLSSEEYIKAIKPYIDQGRIITPWFMQVKNGVPEFQAVHAKNARGSLMHWIIKNRITDHTKLVAFNQDRYKFSPALSTQEKPVFTRKFIPVSKV